MEFKKIGMRAIVLISIAVLLILITFLGNHHPKSEVIDDQIPPVASLPAVGKPLEIVEHPVGMLEGDDEALKEMKEQMDADRNQQRQIKMLKMQLEQVNLQLENEKAMAEINKLKSETAGYVRYPQVNSGVPNIKIIYIGGAETSKEAILSINGTSYSVKVNDRPVTNVEVLGITDQGVKVHLSAPRQRTTFINYVQE
jgi:hypothetical protein